MPQRRLRAAALTAALALLAAGCGGSDEDKPAEDNSLGKNLSKLELTEVTKTNFCPKLDQEALAATLPDPVEPWSFNAGVPTCSTFTRAEKVEDQQVISVQFNAGKTLADVQAEAEALNPDAKRYTVPGVARAQAFVTFIVGTTVAVEVADGYVLCALGGTDDPAERDARGRLCVEQVYLIAG